MARLDDVRVRAPSFKEEVRERYDRAMGLLKQFLERFPFHVSPRAIEELRYEDVYSPGSGDYFFYWVEHRLRDLGAIAVGSTRPYVNAADNLNVFKGLLYSAVERGRSLAEKVDAEWNMIKGFGGDRHIAKKIIYLYNHKEAFPIFKTEDFKQFVEELGINPEKEAETRLRRPFEQLTVGEKWQLLTQLLKEIRESAPELRELDNLMIGYLLYAEIEPKAPRLSGTQALLPSTPLSPCGLLFEPRSEAELLLLFGRYHRELGFPYILAVRDRFPDIIAIDEDGELKRIELELKSRSFPQHEHRLEDCDHIICWEDDWEAPEEAAGKILSMKDRIRDIISSAWKQ
ncbi:MAG: hypothetical protein QXH67_00090 [Candidatus Bathyarchaeia archaeon]